MTDFDAYTPISFLREGLERIEAKVDKLADSVAEGQSQDGAMNARLVTVERVAFGAIGIVLVAVVGALLRIVVKG